MLSGRTRGALAVALALVAESGCGLSTAGSESPAVDASTSPLDGATPRPDGGVIPSGDGGADVGVSPGVDAGCSLASCPGGAPTGFIPVAFETSRAAPCPSGFDSTDVIENPVAGPGACSCGACNAPLQPGSDCQNGTINSTYGNGGVGCFTPGAQLSANGGQCNGGQAGKFGSTAAVFAPAAAVGACTAQATPHPDQTAAQQERLCAPLASTCGAAACDPSLAPTFLSCLAASGDVTCPSGVPTKHLVGPGASITCGACGCSATATCQGMVAFYSSQNCTGQTVITLNGDGTCTTTNNASFGSYQWTGTPNVQCNAGSSAGVASVDTPTTVCCP